MTTSTHETGAVAGDQNADGAIQPIGSGGIPSISADAFKAAFRGHPGGVALITAVGPDGPVALTATSVASISADPPLLIFSVSTQSSSSPTITAAESVVVHLLDADHLELARLGATSGIDRFANRSQWSTLPTGEPVFHGPVWLRSIVVDRLGAGGATVIVAEPVESNLAGDRDNGESGALVYHHHRWHRLGLASRIDDHAI